jgi:plastocyanin
MDDLHRRLTDIVAHSRSGRITRRRALQLAGAAGLVGIAGPALGGVRAAAQDTATPVASPAVGPQADGTTLWKVQVGGMDMETGIDLQAFFPGEITINTGDTIWFAFAPMGVPGFHTVTFTSGADVPPLFAPDVVDGTPVASPEGPPRLLLNPQIAFPDGRTSYDGTGYVNSGLDVLRVDQSPYTLTFTAPGTFDYLCAVHGIVMKGKVTVQETGASLPKDIAAYETIAHDEMAKLIDEGKAAIAAAEQAASSASPMAGAATWEVAAGLGGKSQARVMRFSPRTVTIKAGDTVRWTDRTIGEPHTVTFLGGTEPPEDTLIEPQAGGPPKLIQSYQTFLPSGGATFDGTGYHNSGFLGLPPEIGGQFGLNGDSYELTFTAAGEYPYYCILHSSGPDDETGMIGTVVVEA